jgi:muconolactone D-isomerase
MRFMLRIEVTLPHGMADAEKDDLRKREHERAHELIASGRLLRIWRIVGRIANFSVWEAPTLEALHDTLAALPMFPYMKIDVTPLVDHPLTAHAESVHGATGRAA